MWCVDPEIMCRNHLLGEHFETHMFLSHINSGKGFRGYVTGNKLEVLSLVNRHDELVEEMKRRGYNHKSPIDEPDLRLVRNDQEEYIDGCIDTKKSLKELLGRCDKCRERYNKKHQGLV